MNNACIYKCLAAEFGICTFVRNNRAHVAKNVTSGELRSKAESEGSTNLPSFLERLLKVPKPNSHETIVNDVSLLGGIEIFLFY